MQLALENSVETPLPTKSLSSEVANFLSNVSKRAQFSCYCCTEYLRSTTTVTRLTEDDDVIKSLLRGSPHQGLAFGTAHRYCIGPRICLDRYCKLHIQKNLVGKYLQAKTFG